MHFRNFSRKEMTSERGYCAVDWRAQEIPGNECIFARKNEKTASVTQIR